MSSSPSTPITARWRAGPGREPRGPRPRDPMTIEAEKSAAARAAAALVADGMRVGLGTGSTVRPMLPALAQRGLRLRCVATSVATDTIARKLGLTVEPFE